MDRKGEKAKLARLDKAHGQAYRQLEITRKLYHMNKVSDHEFLKARLACKDAREAWEAQFRKVYGEGV